MTSVSKAVRQAAEQYPIKPAMLVSYQSQGRLLIIGSSERIAAVYQSLFALKITVLLTEAADQSQTESFRSAAIPILATSAAVTVSGYLGNFTLTFSDTEQPSPAFDLILDLQQQPAISLEVPPVGYYTPANQQQLQQMLNELPDMIGHFDKPRFYNLDHNKCAHSNSRLTGCRQCIDACAAEAICSVDKKISVDPYLCQGCGDCTTTCPSGAINYTYPDRLDTLTRLQRMLQAYFKAGATSPVVLLHDQEQLPAVPDFIIPYQIETLGSVGMDVWLAALAYGAAQVLLFDHGAITTHTRQTLTLQLQTAHVTLEGMGYRKTRIGMTSSIPDIAPAARITDDQLQTIKPASFSADADKRSVIGMAVEHLFDNAPEQKTVTKLPESAPFGEIQVNHHCTLCMSCVSICPAGALLAGQQQPRLNFIENNCVQCGLCQTACPEQAITLKPRYNYDPVNRRKPRMLHEESIFYCVRCNKPMASVSMIKSIQDKLQGHPLFQGDNTRRLLMCESCKVESLFDTN